MNAETETQAAQQSPEEFVQAVTSSINLVEHIEDNQLALIGAQVLQEYELDKDSMTDWLEKMERAIELATLAKGEKDYPFRSAANVKYPLVTTAALQFNARAYPAIVPPSDPVKAKIWGPDPDGKKAERGARVSEYMSWQLLVEMDEWDRETDKLLVQLPIVGDLFRKVWFDGERQRCRVVEPGKFIVNARSQSLRLAPRTTEEFCYYPHEIQERINDGRFVEDFEYSTDDDEQEPQEFIEQHTRLDLDEDGYTEPYIVTLHVDKRTVVRVVADFAPGNVRYETEQVQTTQIVQGPMGPVPQPAMAEINTGIKSISRNSYYVHYQFMPGMEDGFFGTGLGILLGDISEAVNSSINMLMDAAHYGSLGGGFIGSDFRIKGGAQRIRPGEWKKVEAKGGDVRNALVPMNFSGADPVMFQMLGMLIEAGKDVSSTKDIITNESAHNMPATTAMALIEQGMKVFTAAFKRIFRSLTHEFALICRINSQTLSPEKYAAFVDLPQGEQIDPRQEFDLTGMNIQPVSDPEAVTKMQEMAKASLVMELLGTGSINQGAAVQRVLEAAGIENIDELLPQPDPLAEQMKMMQMKGAQADLAEKMANIQLTLAKVQSEKAGAVKDIAGAELDMRTREFDEVMRILELQRDDLAKQLAAGFGGMAARPNNPGPQGPAAMAVTPPPRGIAGPMVAG